MIKRKKIAFVTPVYLPAPLYGSDKYVWYLAEDLAERGHDVSIITTKALTSRYWYDPLFGKSITREYEIIHKVKVYRLDSQFWLSSLIFILHKISHRFLPSFLDHKLSLMSSGPWFKGLTKILVAKHFEIVHNSPFPLQFNKQVVDAINKITPKPKLIFTPFFHEKVQIFANPQIYFLFRSADVIHVISNSEKKAILIKYPDLAIKIKVIPLFVKLPKKYSCGELTNEIRNLKTTYNLMERKIILFVGIKGEMKGATDLLFAVNELYKEDKRFLLIALGSETSAWEQSKKKINPECLLDIAYVDGESKHAFYCLCDIFCMPSKSETFGFVYVEAWHKKKPVIAADIPAVRELIADNNGGILVKFGDRAGLVKAIKSLIENKNKSLEYGKNGYQAFLKKYNYNVLIREYLNLFS